MSRVIRGNAQKASHLKAVKRTKSAKAKTYLTADILGRAVSRGIRQASREAMKTAGSVVAVHEGWVVRKMEDGSMIKIKKLPKVSMATLQTKTAKLAFK